MTTDPSLMLRLGIKWPIIHDQKASGEYINIQEHTGAILDPDISDSRILHTKNCVIVLFRANLTALASEFLVFLWVYHEKIRLS
jgi:hypothetical protein